MLARGGFCGCPFPSGPSRPKQSAQLSPRSRAHDPAAESPNCFQLSPEKPPGPAYTINVEPLSGIKPRMYSGGFENRPGDLGTTAIVVADAPEAAVEKAFNLFPEYRRVSRRGHVFEVEYAEVDWDTGRAFVIQVKKRPPRLQGLGDARHGPRAGELEGGQPL